MGYILEVWCKNYYRDAKDPKMLEIVKYFTELESARAADLKFTKVTPNKAK